MITRPKSARAVGQALGENPLPLIFPWHRVVATDGLGGFSSGPGTKEYLLRWEKLWKAGNNYIHEWAGIVGLPEAHDIMKHLYAF